MAHVKLIANHFNKHALYIGSRVARWLEDHGHSSHPKADAFLDYSCYITDQWGADEEERFTSVIAIGGDGTMLEAAHLAWDQDIPVFGINMGRRGYLAEVNLDEWEIRLEDFFAGNFNIEPRMGLSASVLETNPVESIDFALNEIVLESATFGRVINVSIAINGQEFADIDCNGVIVSSPTGSTGYSLSAGGPILAPRMESLIITPIAPTSLFNRSIVIDRDGVVELTLKGRSNAFVSYDGIVFDDLVPIGSTVHIERQSSLQLVEFGEDKFHQTLKNKFGL